MEHKNPSGAPSCGKHAVPGLFAGGRVFGRQQHGAAPLAAQSHPLSYSAERQQSGGRHADGCVRRQQTDAHGGNAHGEQCRDQSGLASDAIAEMAEQRRPDRTREKCEGKGGQRLQHRRGGIAFGEKKFGKHQHRGGGVDIEVEKFDGCADETREQNAARLLRVGPGYRVEQSAELQAVNSDGNSPRAVRQWREPREPCGIEGVGRDRGAGRYARPPCSP